MVFSIDISYSVHICAAGFTMRLVVSVCVCMYIYIYIYKWTKKLAVWGLTTGKSPVSVIYCSFVEFNGQKGAYYARQFVLGRKLELFY